MSFDKSSSIDDISELDEFVFINWSHILYVCTFFLDWISFMADKILSLSIEYVSFSSLISDAMTFFFHEQLQNVTSF